MILQFKRLDLIEKIEELKDSIENIENVVMESNIETGDEELKSLEDRVRELQKQIQDLMD